jgi:hypothetical protein
VVSGELKIGDIYFNGYIRKFGYAFVNQFWTELILQNKLVLDESGFGSIYEPQIWFSLDQFTTMHTPTHHSYFR